MKQRRAVLVSAVTTALTALAIAGCGADSRPQLSPPPASTQATSPSGPGQSTGTTPTPQTPSATPDAKLQPPLAFNVRRRAQLRAKPNGKVVATVKTKTEFKSPTILAVAARRPGWVQVRTSIAKHQVGWLPLSAGHLFSEPRTIVIDLSKRTLSVFHRGTLTDTYKVAIGTDATPTPVGRFAVTDRLTTGAPNGDYGCCILALTAHQAKIAQGWGGGDRVAIHATPHTWTIGKKISHGCVRGTNKALHQLMAHARLGMPVTIHR
jgi:lipoprotein-anchoring transpeptidase ErfK/SrfK